jgi:hypothetical protein
LVVDANPRPSPEASVGEHAERDVRAWGTQSHDEMDLAGVETERDPLIGPITAEFRRPTRCDVAAGSGPVACKAVVPLPAEQMPTVPRMTGAGGVMP